MTFEGFDYRTHTAYICRATTVVLIGEWSLPETLSVNKDHCHSKLLSLFLIRLNTDLWIIASLLSDYRQRGQSRLHSRHCHQLSLVTYLSAALPISCCIALIWE